MTEAVPGNPQDSYYFYILGVLINTVGPTVRAVVGGMLTAVKHEVSLSHELKMRENLARPGQIST